MVKTHKSDLFSPLHFFYFRSEEKSDKPSHILDPFLSILVLVNFYFRLVLVSF